MTLEEILLLQPKAQIDELQKGRLKENPDLKDVLASIDVKKHEVFDETLRQDKIIELDDGTKRIEKVGRIGLAFQKLIVKKQVSFLFGNPVLYTNESSETEATQEIYEAFQKILKDVKINSFNRRIARDLFSTTEVAELWFPVENKEEGAEEKYKLKAKKLSVLTGDELYPYFDEFGDMLVFSRAYTTGENKYFEIYTNDLIIKYDTTKDPVLVEGYPMPNPIGKIPIVYGAQEESAFYDVEELIKRLEKLLSNFADTNDYHAAPKLFVKGTIKGFSKKGESGAIIEGEESTDVKYLSWNNAPEAVKTEVSTLTQMIYTISQTPDVSFENVKQIGGGAISGKAMKLMFLDAHLKVMDNMEVFDEYLQRRASIIKAFISKMRTDKKNAINEFHVEPKVTPYMLDDVAEQLDFIMVANGNKPVISKRTGVKMSGLVEDIDTEMEEIQKEEAFNVFEPTGL